MKSIDELTPKQEDYIPEESRELNQTGGNTNGKANAKESK